MNHDIHDKSPLHLALGTLHMPSGFDPQPSDFMSNPQDFVSTSRTPFSVPTLGTSCPPFRTSHLPGLRFADEMLIHLDFCSLPSGTFMANPQLSAIPQPLSSHSWQTQNLGQESVVSATHELKPSPVLTSSLPGTMDPLLARLPGIQSSPGNQHVTTYNCSASC